MVATIAIGQPMEVRLRKAQGRTDYVRGDVLGFVENGDEVLVNVGFNGTVRFDLVVARDHVRPDDA